MKNFCEKQHQHRQWCAVFVDVWSLTFFTPFAGLTKGWIFVFLPWGGPQVGNTPLVVACVSISAEACCSSSSSSSSSCWWWWWWCCWSSSSSSSSKSFSKSLASKPDSVGVSNQNFTDTFLIKCYFFPGHCDRHVQQTALFTLLCRSGTVQEPNAAYIWTSSTVTTKHI